jgi:hypothetical protein
MRTERQLLEEERRQRRKKEDRALERYLQKINVPTRVESLSYWDRCELLDRIRGF